MARQDSNDQGSDDDRESDQGSANIHFRKPKYALAESHGSMYLKMGAVCEFLFVSGLSLLLYSSAIFFTY